MLFTFYDDENKLQLDTIDKNELNQFMLYNGIDYIISRIEIIDNDVMIYFKNDNILIIQDYENEYKM